MGKEAPPELRLLLAQATFELPIFESIEDVDRALAQLNKLDEPGPAGLALLRAVAAPPAAAESRRLRQPAASDSLDPALAPRDWTPRAVPVARWDRSWAATRRTWVSFSRRLPSSAYCCSRGPPCCSRTTRRQRRPPARRRSEWRPLRRRLPSRRQCRAEPRRPCRAASHQGSEEPPRRHAALARRPSHPTGGVGDATRRTGHGERPSSACLESPSRDGDRRRHCSAAQLAYPGSSSTVAAGFGAPSHGAHRAGTQGARAGAQGTRVHGVRFARDVESPVRAEDVGPEPRGARRVPHEPEAVATGIAQRTYDACESCARRR